MASVQLRQHARLRALESPGRTTGTGYELVETEIVATSGAFHPLTGPSLVLQTGSPAPPALVGGASKIVRVEAIVTAEVTLVLGNSARVGLFINTRLKATMLKIAATTGAQAVILSAHRIFTTDAETVPQPLEAWTAYTFSLQFSASQPHGVTGIANFRDVSLAVKPL